MLYGLIINIGHSYLQNQIKKLQNRKLQTFPHYHLFVLSDHQIKNKLHILNYDHDKG